jgi:hypothetical protein
VRLLGPIVGAAGSRAAHVIAEIPRGVTPEIEVRRERRPAKPTSRPGRSGWTGTRVNVDPGKRTGGCVYRFTATSLDPRRTYRYRIVDRSTGEPLAGLDGRFRSPGTGAGPTRVVLVSCNKERAFTDGDIKQNVWRDLTDRIDADPTVRLVIHCGDQVYCDPVWEQASTEYYQHLEPLERERWLRRSTGVWRRRAREIYRATWSQLGRLGARVAYGDEGDNRYRILNGRPFFGRISGPINRRGYAVVTIDRNRPPTSRVSVRFRVERELGGVLEDTAPIVLG